MNTVSMQTRARLPRHIGALICSLSLLFFFAARSYAQSFSHRPHNDETAAEYQARMARLTALERQMFQSRPYRRETPARAENVRDEEVREIQLAAAAVYPGAILNISTVVTGCPCEEGPSCADQVWVVAYKDGETLGVSLSKLSGHWSLGAVQKWWFEYKSLQSRAKAMSWPAYADAEQVMLDRYPACEQSRLDKALQTQR